MVISRRFLSDSSKGGILSYVALALLCLLISPEKSFAAKPLPLSGTLDVEVIDSANSTYTKTFHKLKTESGKTLQLKFRGTPPDGLVTGQKVHFKDHKRLNASTAAVFASEMENLPSATATAEGLSGTRSVLSILVSSTSSAGPNATATQVVNNIVGVNAHSLVYSYGSLSFSTDLANDGTPDVYSVRLNQSTAGVPESNSSGQSNAMAFCDTARSLVSSQYGVDSSKYSHVVCYMPTDMAFGSIYGRAGIGGNRIIINGNYSVGYVDGLFHEIEHNLGMHHANTPGATTDGTEYGDQTCIMGGNAGTAPRHFNAPHKKQMGWVPVNAVGAGTYEINAIENQPAQWTAPYMVLTVRDPITSELIHLSFRQPIGLYTSGPIDAGRTHIHTHAGGSSRTFRIAEIGDGQSFSRNGLTFTQVSHTAATATIQITAVCVAAAPSVTISPSEIKTSTLGAKAFQMTVTNKDTNCSDPIQFDIVPTLPSAEWTSQVTSGSLLLSPGQSSSIAVEVTPPLTLAQGAYNMSFAITAAGHASTVANTKFTFDATAPGQITNLTATVGNKRRVTLAWSAPTDEGGSGISSYTIYRNGESIATTTALQYTDITPSEGTYVYQVQATDGVGNSGELSSFALVTVTRTRTGGGGKPNRR